MVGRRSASAREADAGVPAPGSEWERAARAAWSFSRKQRETVTWILLSSPVSGWTVEGVVRGGGSGVGLSGVAGDGTRRFIQANHCCDSVPVLTRRQGKRRKASTEARAEVTTARCDAASSGLSFAETAFASRGVRCGPSQGFACAVGCAPISSRRSPREGAPRPHSFEAQPRMPIRAGRSYAWALLHVRGLLANHQPWPSPRPCGGEGSSSRRARCCPSIEVRTGTDRPARAAR